MNTKILQQKFTTVSIIKSLLIEWKNTTKKRHSKITRTILSKTLVYKKNLRKIKNT